MGAVIDIHTHIVPARLAADPKRDRRWPSIELSAGDQAAVMIGGKVFRKIDARSCDVDRRLSDMVDDGTDMQVLSPMPELLSHWLPPDDAEFLADVMNEQIARMIERAPRNFAGIGMVCAQDVPRAVRQLQKVKALGFAGIDRVDYTDGVRVLFTNGDVAHVRPSGNADELRIYAVADTQDRADAIAAMGIEEPAGILRRMEKSVEG